MADENYGQAHLAKVMRGNQDRDPPLPKPDPRKISDYGWGKVISGKDALKHGWDSRWKE